MPEQITGQADDDRDPSKQSSVDGFGPNDPGQNAVIGPDGLEEVTVEGKRDPKDELEEVVVQAKRPKPEPISGKPGRRTYNPLAKLSSYTYNLTLYMITPDAYIQFIESGRKKIDVLSKAVPVGQGDSTFGGGAFIVAQSGGTNKTLSNRMSTTDYYIDNLRMKTLTSTKETGAAVAAVSEMTFQITEPYGFSFITDLKNASDQLKTYSSSTSYKDLSAYFRQFFILGVRFYGYDAGGKLIKGSDQIYGEAIDPLGGDALFENFYDIIISSVKFKITGDAVVYNIRAVVPVTQNLLGTKRGRMPTGATVQGRTVGEALSGPYGLFTQLNAKEQTKVNTKSQTYPNAFEVQFLGDAEKLIKDAPLATEDDLSKYRYGGTGSKKTTDVNDSKNEVPPDPTVKMFTFNHDTSIISAIETIVKKSQFMVNALKTIYSNVYEPNTDKKNYEQTEKESGALRWFTVTTDIKKADWDPKLSDWAFKTVYIVQIYDTPSIETPYSGLPRKYYGPHKRYQYWFTGKNTEILDFDLNFEYAYYNSILGLGENVTPAASPSTGGGRETNNGAPQNSGSSPGNNNSTAGNTGLKQEPKPGTEKDSSAGTASGGGQVPVTPGLRNNGDKTSGLAVNLETYNSVTTYLYDIAAFNTSRLKIIGDPDFLVRDAATSINSLYNQFYNTDGFTVNANGGQVFIEIGFKEGKDYKNSTGLQTINENILLMSYPPEVTAISKNNLIYMVTSVDSTFYSGKFEQILNLVLPIFPGSAASPPTSPKPEQPAQQPSDQKADDDELQPVTITSKKREEAGREDELQPVTITSKRPTVAPTSTQEVPDVYTLGGRF